MRSLTQTNVQGLSTCLLARARSWLVAVPIIVSCTSSKSSILSRVAKYLFLSFPRWEGIQRHGMKLRAKEKAANTRSLLRTISFHLDSLAREWCWHILPTLPFNVKTGSPALSSHREDLCSSPNSFRRFNGVCNGCPKRSVRLFKPFKRFKTFKSSEVIGAFSGSRVNSSIGKCIRAKCRIANLSEGSGATALGVRERINGTLLASRSKFCHVQNIQTPQAE